MYNKIMFGPTRGPTLQPKLGDFRDLFVGKSVVRSFQGMAPSSDELSVPDADVARSSWEYIRRWDQLQLRAGEEPTTSKSQHSTNINQSNIITNNN